MSILKLMIYVKKKVKKVKLNNCKAVYLQFKVNLEVFVALKHRFPSAFQCQKLQSSVNWLLTSTSKIDVFIAYKHHQP